MGRCHLVSMVPSRAAGRWSGLRDKTFSLLGEQGSGETFFTILHIALHPPSPALPPNACKYLRPGACLLLGLIPQTPLSAPHALAPSQANTAPLQCGIWEDFASDSMLRAQKICTACLRLTQSLLRADLEHCQTPGTEATASRSQSHTPAGGPGKVTLYSPLPRVSQDKPSGVWHCRLWLCF